MPEPIPAEKRLAHRLGEIIHNAPNFPAGKYILENQHISRLVILSILVSMLASVSISLYFGSRFVEKSIELHRKIAELEVSEKELTNKISTLDQGLNYKNHKNGVAFNSMMTILNKHLKLKPEDIKNVQDAVIDVVSSSRGAP